MRWNSSEYGNVQDVRIPPKVIWTPDLLMYNRWVNLLSSRKAYRLNILWIKILELRIQGEVISPAHEHFSM
jgi:hypothetical protein